MSVALLLTLLSIPVIAPNEAAAVTSGGWSNLGHGATATTPPLTGTVETFTSVGTSLYLGGDFINAGGLPKADHIATWNGTSWAALGDGLGDAASAVYAIAVDPTTGKVFAGGSFQDAGGDSQADRIAVFNGTTWTSLSSVGLNGPVFALAIVGRTLYVGGGFDNVGGAAEADSIVAYNIDTGAWSATTDESGDIGGTVSSIVPDGSGGLYVGGNFIDANRIDQADFVARWTGGVSWSALGGSAALNQRVRALAISGSDLYVGGDYTNADGIAAADKVAHWNGSSWSSLGSSIDAGGMAVYSVLVDRGTVVIAGYFNNAGGLAKADGIAAYNGSTWTNVGTNASGTDGPVSLNTQMNALRVVGNKLYLGGHDSSIGDSTMNGYAAWYRVRQPDGQIAVGTGPFVGNNIYNTNGNMQVKSQTVHRTMTGTFSIKISNDGLGSDSFTVKGGGTSGAFTATYLNGAVDITAQVVAGTYAVNNLAAGASKTLTLKVKVGSGAAVGSSKAFLVTTTSTGGGTPKDAVKAAVTAS
jgi:hypothetical protein